jgi:hypothetical protein
VRSATSAAPRRIVSLCRELQALEAAVMRGRRHRAAEVCEHGFGDGLLVGLVPGRGGLARDHVRGVGLAAAGHAGVQDLLSVPMANAPDKPP